jgi:acyl-CoA thioester hydrolase
MNDPAQVLDAPTICPPHKIVEDWIDYNGHLNMAFYNVIFDKGVDHIFDYLGIGEEYARKGIGSCFILEAHVHYIQELSLDDDVEVHFQLLDFDRKRIHFFEQMYHRRDGYLAATSEQIGLHVNMASRRSAPFPDAVMDKLAGLRSAHSDLEIPAQVGHVIGIPERPN